MDRFLETYNLPKLNQEDINHLKRSITQKVIEAAIKSLPKIKVQDLMDSLLNSISIPHGSLRYLLVAGR
jgi:hypothetical protein